MAEGLGKYDFANSVIFYFTMISQLGIPTYGITCCARIRDDKIRLSKTVHELMIINIIMVFVSYILFAICVLNIPKFLENRFILVITSTSILFSAIGVSWLYSALEQYTYITIRSIAFKILSIIAMFIFVRNSNDFVIYATINVIATGGANVLNLLHSKKFIEYRNLHNYDLKRHFKPIFVFFMMSVATTIYTSLDVVMLGFMDGDSAVGYYGTAVKIKTILVSVVTSLSAVLLPRASYYIENNMKKAFLETMAKSLNFVYFISVPLVVYSVLFAKECILVLSGEGFLPSVIPMRIITPCVFFIGLTNVIGIQMMVPLKKERCVMISEIAGALCDFSLNILLIPRFSVSGAAIATLITEFVVLVVQVYYMKNIVGDILKKVDIRRVLFGTIISVLAVLGFKLYVQNHIMMMNWVILLISAVLFFGIYSIILLAVKNQTALMIYETIHSKLRMKR